jgi:hypothetical protein
MSYGLHGLSAAFGVVLLMVGMAMVFSKNFFERSGLYMLTAAVFGVIGIGIAVSGAVLYLIERITLT